MRRAPRRGPAPFQRPRSQRIGDHGSSSTSASRGLQGSRGDASGMPLHHRGRRCSTPRSFVAATFRRRCCRMALRSRRPRSAGARGSTTGGHCRGVTMLSLPVPVARASRQRWLTPRGVVGAELRGDARRVRLWLWRRRPFATAQRSRD
jgi:hypothetical protein